jgi:hypothetical protein
MDQARLMDVDRAELQGLNKKSPETLTGSEGLTGLRKGDWAE